MGAEGDCEELSLELSIGGKYAGKSENLGDKTRGFCGENANCESRCDFSESIDLQKRRGIQASRRLEARRKREERVRKSRGVNNVVGFVDDKLFLEEQRFGERARDREIREKELFYEGKNGGGEAADELRLSLFSDNKEKKRGNRCLYPNVQLAEATSDSDNSNGVKPLEKCSSAMSDYLSMSQKGGSSSDAGSHDSAETERCHKSKASWMTSPEGEGTNMMSSGGEAPKASPRLRHMQMPCVSATGDGPNGRRVLGFLYKYDKREVSIMCVCHGSSFSPAEFVEHAGGVDVSHPLRHITLVTS